MRDFRLPIGLIDQVRGLSRAALQQAPEATAPLLIVQGKRDDVVRVPQTRKLMRRLPGEARYVEVDAGHDLILPEKPAWPQVEAAVVEFARRVAAGRSNNGPVPGEGEP
jgi:pimeloyl-ACP methyl ester carboxylesterase